MAEESVGCARPTGGPVGEPNEEKETTKKERKEGKKCNNKKLRIKQNRRGGLKAATFTKMHILLSP